MVKTLIFDFGDVFINLDKEGAMRYALDIFKIQALSHEMIELNKAYEQGHITTSDFVRGYQDQVSGLSETELIDIWNYIIKDFPMHRLSFLKDLSSKGDYELILLSNTNDLHIDFIKKNVSFYEEFKDQFDKFYLSHEIHLRKPEPSIFQYVIDNNNLKPNQCLFIDDTPENTETADKMGLHTWTIDPASEDVVHLFKKFDHLF